MLSFKGLRPSLVVQSGSDGYLILLSCRHWLVAVPSTAQTLHQRRWSLICSSSKKWTRKYWREISIVFDFFMLFTHFSIFNWVDSTLFFISKILYSYFMNKKTNIPFRYNYSERNNWSYIPTGLIVAPCPHNQGFVASFINWPGWGKEWCCWQTGRLAWVYLPSLWSCYAVLSLLNYKSGLNRFFNPNLVLKY